MARPPKPLTPDRSFAQFYGSRIRQDRDEAGMTLEELAQKLHCDPSQVSRYEHGERVPGIKTAQILDLLFGTSYYTEHNAVAANSRIPVRARPIAHYESGAAMIRSFSHGTVVGLLQSPSYVRALVRDGLMPQAIDEVSDERARRQEVLDGDPPAKLQAIMDETVIRRLTSHPEIARQQIKLILDRMEKWNVQVQLVHQSNFSYPGLQCSFTIYESRENGSLAAWHDGVGKAGRVIEDKAIIADLLESYDLIRSAAMSAAESRDVLKTIQESL
nr:helix-turn-helix transcriptional regulator [Actinomadura atramentaria]